MAAPTIQSVTERLKNADDYLLQMVNAVLDDEQRKASVMEWINAHPNQKVAASMLKKLVCRIPLEENSDPKTIEDVMSCIIALQEMSEHYHVKVEGLYGGWDDSGWDRFLTVAPAMLCLYDSWDLDHETKRELIEHIWNKVKPH